MYKIEAIFESDVNGIYTHTVETADTYDFANIKYDRIIEHWHKILCKNDNLKGSSSMKLSEIQSCIKCLNEQYQPKDRNRTFKITLEEI